MTIAHDPAAGIASGAAAPCRFYIAEIYKNTWGRRPANSCSTMASSLTVRTFCGRTFDAANWGKQSRGRCQ